MPAYQGDACFEFGPSLALGNDLLVYAHRIDPGDEDYFPIPCNTVLIKKAGDIRDLGPGRKPNSK
jgi:hypothetical protein